MKMALDGTKNEKSVLVTITRCLLVVLMFILSGYAFFSRFYNWTFIDSLYFAMVTGTAEMLIYCTMKMRVENTVTTVGYGDMDRSNDNPEHQTFVWVSSEDSCPDQYDS